MGGGGGPIRSERFTGVFEWFVGPVGGVRPVGMVDAVRLRRGRTSAIWRIIKHGKTLRFEFLFMYFV